jgi:hypothetical protein
MNAIKALAFASFLILLAGLAGRAQTTFSNAVMDFNPAAYWPMHENEPAAPGPIETNEGTLGRIGNAYFGTWENPSGGITNQIPGALSGDTDTAMSFGGVNPDYLLVPLTSPQVSMKPPFTVECWANGYSGVTGDIIGQRGEKLNGGSGAVNDNGWSIGYGGTASGYEVLVENGSAVVTLTSGAISANTWYHIVVTCDANTNWTMYLNGTVVGTINSKYETFAPTISIPITLGGGFWEGSAGAFRPFHGAMDEVALYTNVLAGARIQAHYNAGLNPATYGAYETNVLADSPVVYYHMDAPAYTAPPANTLPVLDNYGSAALNGVYTAGATPGAATGPYNPNGIPVAGLTQTNSLPCNGLSSFADAGNSTLYNFSQTSPAGGTPFTITAMFRGNPTDSRVQSIIGHGTTSWQIVLTPAGLIDCNSGNGAVTASPANDLICTTAYNDGRWHQLFYAYDGTNTESLYVDGLLATNKTAAVFTNGPGSVQDVLIGADPNYTNNPVGIGRQFAGQVCEVALFTNCLTGAQVQTLYNASGIAPYVTGQPVAEQVVNGGPGSSVSFSVLAGGSASLAYQWYFNTSSNYGGARPLVDDAVHYTNSTTSQLTVTNLTSADSGYYYAVITNGDGSITSSLASLTVNLLPTVNSQYPVAYTNLITLFAGANPAFSVSVGGTQPYYYEWFTNGVLDGAATINASLRLTNVQMAFTNYCIVTNIGGSVTSTVWNVAVIAAPTAPYPQDVLAANPAGYWRLNEPDDGNGFNDGNDGALCHDYVSGNDGLYTNTVLGQTGYNANTDPTETSASFGENDISFDDSLAGWIQGVDFAESNGSQGEFTIEAWANGYNSGQIVGAPVVAKGVYGVNDQFSLSIDPTKKSYRFFVCDTNGIQYICDASNSFALDNNWHHLVGVCDQANGEVSLYIDGRLAKQAAIPTGSGIYESPAPMTIGAAASDLAGQNFSYQFYGYVDDVSVYRYAMSANQVAAQYSASGVPPFLSQAPPTSVGTNGGGPLVIPVEAIGTGPLNYIWSDVSAGTNIVAGTTNGNLLNATLAVGSVAAGWNNDQLELTVSDIYGTTNVYVALTIATNPPQITQNLPAQVSVVSGKSYTYAIGANGMQPFGYQWYNGNAPIIGQTAASKMVTAGNPGSTTYSVVITNIFGAATSSVSTFTSVAQLTNTYAAGILAFNPAGYWPLQETNAPAAVTMETNYGTLGATGNAYYAVTNAGDVTFGQSGALTASGNNDTCVYFPGTSTTYLDSFLLVPQKVSALGLRPPLTLEAWVNANNTGLSTQDFLGQGDGNNGVRLSWNTSGNGVFAAIFRNSAQNGAYQQFNYPVPAANQWYHAVLTYDGANVNFYLNGVLQGTTNATMTTSSAPLTIGNGLWAGPGTSPERPFNGYEDEVAVYTNVLTAQQISNHYLAATTAGSNYFQTVGNDRPLLYYHMDCAGYTNVSALYCPEAVNYGSAAPNGAYLSGVAPGGVAGPALVGSINSNTVAAPINGEISCVDAGYDPTFNPSGSQPFTVMTWFRAYPADARGQTIMGHGGQNWTMNLTGSGLIAWSLYNGGAVGSTESFNDGNWHMAAGVFDGTNINLYMDGELNNTAVATGVMTNETNTHLYLGGNADFTQIPGAQQYFAGALAQAALFTNALTATQIQAIYVSSQPVTVSANPTNILFSLTGNNQLTLSWPADHTGWTLQAQTNGLSVGLSTNWVNVSGSAITNQIIIPVNLTNGTVFYRLMYQP